MADPYTPVHADWKDYPDVTTPLTAAALEQIEAGIVEAISRHIVNAKGDLIVATAADVVARQAVGANGRALVADSAQSTGVKWGTPDFIGVRARRTTAQTITTATVTEVSFNASDDYDTDAIHDPLGATPQRLIIPAGLAGKWRFTGGFRWTDDTAGDARFCAIQLNGTTVIAGDIKPPGATTGRAAHSVSAELSMSVADYVTLLAFHTKGSNLDIATTNHIYLAGQFLGA